MNSESVVTRHWDLASTIVRRVMELDERWNAGGRYVIWF